MSTTLITCNEQFMTPLAFQVTSTPGIQMVWKDMNRKRAENSQQEKRDKTCYSTQCQIICMSFPKNTSIALNRLQFKSLQFNCTTAALCNATEN